MSGLAQRWYLHSLMSDGPQNLNLLTAEFETVAAEIRICLNPKRRIELLKRMKILIDRIDDQIFASLNQPRVADPKLILQESAS